METKPENADSVEEDVNNIESEPNFAAVPIHFRPKEGAKKLIKLVIPGIEPPLGFFEVTGDSPESLTMTQVDGPESSEEGETVVEEEVDQSDEIDVAHSAALKENDEIDKSETTVEPEDEEELSYPHEDESGNPIAGFLLGTEENPPLVIIVRPDDGQTAEIAMTEEGLKHPEHMPGSISEAEKLLGHSPLTSGDN